MGTLDGKVVEETQTLEERQAAASHCMSALELDPIAALVDDMADAANLAYEAWPDRLFLIDVEGRVAFRSPPGPFGFEPDELEAAIESELARGSTVAGNYSLDE